MQLPPLSVIESWPAANHKDPIRRGPANIITNLLFFVLASIVVFVRLFARIRISRSFGWDDALIVLSMFPATAFAVLGLLTTTKYEWDRHIWDVHSDLIVVGLKLSIANEILFSIATTLTKLSMLALTYRVVSQGSGRLWRWIIAAMVLISTQNLSFVFVVLFQCGNPNTYWTLTFARQPQCLSETKNLLAAGIINTVTDLIVVILPMPMVYGLQLPRKQQIAVAVLFGVGILVTLAGAARTIYLYKTTSSWDKTWLAYPVYITSSVELYIGIICASIPATKIFFTHFLPRFLEPSTISHDVPYRNASTTSHSRLKSVVIGNSDGVTPLQAMQLRERKYDAQFNHSDLRKSHQMLSAIPVFPTSTNDALSRPESQVETIYESSKAESHDGLITDSSISPTSPDDHKQATVSQLPQILHTPEKE